MSADFVLDSSAALSWCFPDEQTPASRQLLLDMGRRTALVPTWWCLEICNVLSIAERKGRLSTPQLDQFVALLDGLAIETDNEATSRVFTHILPLCRAHQLTSYDAIYLELAIRRRLPLATLDDPLRRAAASLGVKLLGR